MSITLDELLTRADRSTEKEHKVTFLPEPQPAEVWATVVSVDDHVVEPPDTFHDRFAHKFADDAPRVVDTDDGGQAWLWNGKLLPNVGFNAVAGRPRDEHTAEPSRFADMRRGAWDPKSRLADMDLDGVWASLCFPSFLPGFVGQRLTLWPDDRDLAFAAMRAYNDWHLEAWCGTDLTRFIPQQIAWLRDPVVAGDEIRRNADRGFKAVSFSEAPHKFGLPSIHSGYWEPFFAACAETGTVVCLHVGSGGDTVTTSDDAPGEVVSALFAASSFVASVDWLYSGVPVRHPEIKICMSEGGLGWVPGVIDRIDHLTALYDQSSTKSEVNTDIFRRNFWFCALDDPSGFVARHVIGVDNILVESDYPHGDSSWPNTQSLLRRHLQDVPVEEQQKMCWMNAVELFRHTPPTHPLP